ncbi:MAG: 1-acyl-sn-glycerol-3-phosphate acyltransferase [Candidatus Brocadia sp.]|nr:1-acyl-sn-glycerol-3-phosphate acyltransferase [Candidatus Brocadia sp.]
MYKLYQIVFTVYSWTLFVSLWMLSTLTAMIVSMDTKRKENAFNTIERVFSRIAFKLLGMRVIIQGRENIPENEPVIFISNHQSMMDIKLSLAFIPTNFSFISKDTVFHVPILGSYMTASGHIPIQRTDDRKAYETLLTAIRKLSSKKSLVVFPEGTRSEDGKLGTFKRGISLIILKSGKRVVPMAICGSNQFMPKRGWLSHPEKRHVKISFGKPLSFDSARTDREYTLYVTNTLQAEVSKLLHA